MGRLSPPMLEALERFVERRLGLFFAERRHKDLERGILAAARSFGESNPERFVAWLTAGDASSSDLERLAAHLTIGETYFFRDKRAFAALEKIILPQLIERRRGTRRLRIWCAGCSSGEEPYSIAILLQRLLPDYDDWSIDISGTDINLVSLRKATVGEYSQWSFRDCDVAGLRPHVVEQSRGRYAVSQRLRRAVRFSYLNLVEDVFPSLANNTVGEDLVICRNVLMYFRQGRGEEVARRLFDCLVDDGYMLLGPAELHMLRAPDIESLTMEGSTCFRRRRGAVPATFGWSPTLPVPTPPPVLAPRPATGVQPTARKRLETVPDGGEKRYRRSSSRHLAPLPAPDVPQDAETPLAEPRALANKGDLEAALASCDRVVAAHKTSVEAHYLRATICFELGDLAGASGSLRKVLYLAPEFIAAHFTAGMVARAQGRQGEALRHFRTARELLADKDDHWEVPESDGMLAGRMTDALAQLLKLGEVQ